MCVLMADFADAKFQWIAVFGLSVKFIKWFNRINPDFAAHRNVAQYFCSSEAKSIVLEM